MLADLLNNLINDTVGKGFPFFAAEITLSVTIVAMLFAKMLKADRIAPTFLIALAGAGIACWFSFAQFSDVFNEGSRVTVFFGGMLRQDLLSVYFRIFLTLFLILTIALTILTGVPDNEDGQDFYTLLFSATIGMMMMASANNLLMVFLSVEMASVPSYVMVGFLKGRKESSEAALKFVVYGAGAAGVMLYGMSLLAGLLGTTDLTTLGTALASADSGGFASAEIRTIAFGILLVFIGLAFKLSLVPFHFWCPDAFEGASAEVAGFLSVASKAGAFALLLRFVIGLSDSVNGSELMTAFGLGLGIVAAVTATVGNLTAYTQTNLKRLLAYSTIAHAGYLLMAVSAVVVMLNASNTTVAWKDIHYGIGAILYYLAVYLFMNLAAFAIVAFVRNQTFDESIDSMKGLYRAHPMLAIAMSLCLVSLIGIPPLGGFLAKLTVFGAVYQACSVHWLMYVVLGAGGLNTVFSLFYYVRILKAMFMQERSENAPKIHIQALDVSYAVILSAMVIVLGVWPSIVQNIMAIANEAGASSLLIGQ
ncbi:MAG: NADH-quinone oxidoreductase subunit N [Fuerstiella sp.]